MAIRSNASTPMPPGDLLKKKLRERGWNQEDLALITGRSATSINSVATGRSGVTPDMAACLGAAFGNGPEVWLQADASYRLSLIETDTTEIENRGRLFSVAPIREMQRRGWIDLSDDVETLNAELKRFFGSGLEGAPTPEFSLAARRADPKGDLSISEKAWCFKVKQLASTLPARSAFSERRVRSALPELRRLAAHPKSARHLAPLLSDFGIRLVVVEPLTNVRIDGAAFWDKLGPVIALSLRYDRIDGFWFTLMHEFSHIVNGDPISIDLEIVDAEGIRVHLADDEMEQRANREAATSLIAAKELQSFIGRVGPLYSRERIIQFANRLKIHPGIIVGQLQFRQEIGYRSMREFLVRVREHVISTALTDGWGQAISPVIARSVTEK